MHHRKNGRVQVPPDVGHGGDSSRRRQNNNQGVEVILLVLPRRCGVCKVLAELRVLPPVLVSLPPLGHDAAVRPEPRRNDMPSLPVVQADRWQHAINALACANSVHGKPAARRGGVPRLSGVHAG